MPDYGGAPPTETWPKAKAAAERALALDSTLAEAHASLAYGTWKYGRDWRGAEREFQRAIALNPGYATGRQWYADYLGGRGRLTESLAEMRRAQALDPLSRVISLEVGRCLYFMHQSDDAAPRSRCVPSEEQIGSSHRVRQRPSMIP
jgi:tetratricopeptide (TPR) repeat protein